MHHFPLFLKAIEIVVVIIFNWPDLLFSRGKKGVY